MNIIIKRTQSIKHFVEGHLYIDENLICDTLENSRSCLSSGIYAIRIMETSNTSNSGSTSHVVATRSSTAATWFTT